MNISRQIIAVLLCSLIVNASIAETPSSEVVIQRGLTYLNSAGEAWIKKRGCVSCHQVPTLIWSHQAASERGVLESNVDLDRWQDWSVNVVNFVKPNQKDDVDVPATMAANIDTMIGLLLASEQASDPATNLSFDQTSHSSKPKANADWRRQFAEKLRDEQADDGSWKACGQLPMQKRPEKETNAVTTLWAAYALQRHLPDQDPQPAITFADSVPDAVSIEWWAVRLLLSDQIADGRADQLREEIFRRQNQDAGWAWKLGDDSDALGTGLALYALAKTQTNSVRLQSARDFLRQTQLASGKWIVPGTKKNAKGKPTATANDWGTAWAVIALLQND